MIKVLDASSTKALIALQAVKDRMGITDSAQDALLTALIMAASDTVVSYLGRELARQRYEERLAGSGRTRLLLHRFPVDRDSVTITIDSVASTDFIVEDPETGVLYRSLFWAISEQALGEEPEEQIVATYKAGYVPPDQIRTWATGQAYTVGQWARPTSPALSPLLFECTVAGSTSGSEPSWPTTTGATVVSGAATFTARDAQEIHKHLEDLVYALVALKHADRLPGLASQSGGGFAETYFVSQTDREIPQSIRDGLDRYRWN